MVGRNMMVVIVSGCHSKRICAFHESLREKLWLTLLENEPSVFTKFSDEFSVLVSPSLWFQRTLPSSLNLSFSS